MENTSLFPTVKQQIQDVLILLVLTITISIISLKYHCKIYVWTWDAYDYASIARNLIRGRGLHSDMIFPLTFTFPFLRKIPQPLVHRSPLYPMVLAGFFSLAPMNELSIKILGIIFFTLTIPLIYYFTLRYFNRLIAFLTALMILLNPQLFLWSVSGLTEPMVCFLFALLLLYMFKANSKVNTISSGIVLGLLFLTREYFLLTLPAVMYFIYRKDQKQVFCFILTYLLVISPWLIRNYLLSGNPLFTMQNYGVIAHNTLNIIDVFVKTTPMPLSYLAKYHPGELAQGILKATLGLGKKLPILLNPVLLIAIFLPLKDKVDKNIIYFSNILFLSLLPIFILYNVETRMYYFLIPLFTMIAVAKFNHFFNNFKANVWHKLAWGILSLTTIIWAVFFLNRFIKINRNWNILANYQLKVYDLAKAAVKDEKIIITDALGAIPWYVDKPAIFIPNKIETLRFCYDTIPFHSMVFIMESNLVDKWLKTLIPLANSQPDNVTITPFPAPGGYLIKWKTFPFARTIKRIE